MVTAMLVWLLCEYKGEPRGSGFMSTIHNVPEMSEVRRRRGVGGVCEMCMYLARGGVEVSG